MITAKKKNKPPKRNIRKEFREQLVRVLKAIDMLDCWGRLSEEKKNKFTVNIIRPTRYERDSEAGVEPRVLDALKDDIKKYMDVELKLLSLKTSVYMRDLLTAGLSLPASIEVAIDESSTDYERWRTVHYTFKSLFNNMEMFNPVVVFSRFKTDLTYVCTTIDQWYYWFKQSEHQLSRAEPYRCLIYTLTREPAHKRYVTIDGRSRPVFRLGNPSRMGVIWAMVSAQLINENAPESDMLSVWVQSHALERCKERLEPLKRPKIQVQMYDAFDKNPEFMLGPDGVRLVAYRYNEAKIGYLVYDIIDNMIIVKTFLLCTQNGTWEGNLLNREYNLSKYTKTYFELDKLYTYIKTDVYMDDELKGIFTKCGCDGLFNVWNNEKQDSLTFDKEYAKNLKKIFVEN